MLFISFEINDFNIKHLSIPPASDGRKRCASAQGATAQSVPWHTGSTRPIKKSGGAQGVGPASRVGSTVPGSRFGMEGAGRSGRVFHLLGHGAVVVASGQKITRRNQMSSSYVTSGSQG